MFTLFLAPILHQLKPRFLLSRELVHGAGPGRCSLQDFSQCYCFVYIMGPIILHANKEYIILATTASLIKAANFFRLCSVNNNAIQLSGRLEKQSRVLLCVFLCCLFQNKNAIDMCIYRLLLFDRVISPDTIQSYCAFKETTIKSTPCKVLSTNRKTSNPETPPTITFTMMWLETDRYYSACGHSKDDGQKYVEESFKKWISSQELHLSCMLPINYALIDDKLCPYCQDGISKPLPIDEREARIANFMLIKAGTDLYRSQLNERNELLEEELCSVEPSMLTPVQLHQLHILHFQHNVHPCVTENPPCRKI